LLLLLLLLLLDGLGLRRFASRTGSKAIVPLLWIFSFCKLNILDSRFLI
jgi:hypothetical protein